MPIRLSIQNIEDPPLFSTQTEATKAAGDNGYRLLRGIAEGWLRFGSTTAPFDILIAYTLTGDWLLSIEHPGVASELPDNGLRGPGAKTIVARTLYELHQALDRNYRLSVSLPTVPLVAFEQETADLRRDTKPSASSSCELGRIYFVRP